CLASCCQCAWGCLELWTPLSVTFIMYWLIYRPDHFHPRIDSAVLATLDLTNATIRYDLAVDLSFRNTRRVAIRYLDVAASIFHPTFHGVVPVDPAVAAELQREIEAGTVHIRVTVSLTLMYKVLFVRDVFFYKYDCWLWFPPPRNHTPALFPGNGGTKCWRV
uniref:Late embryogenesis abundant protein LEA-2 subgroup domain-containing protein n=1 Tax=Setaria italica TaxID=4555 RepID=K3Y265_SETIT